MTARPLHTVVGVALGLGLLGSSQALAWEHTKQVWLPEDMPIRWYSSDDEGENTISNCETSNGTAGCCEESVPSGYCIQAAQEGFDNWHDAKCADFSHEYAGQCDNTGYLEDYQNHFTFNDPDDELDLGVIGETLTRTQGDAFILDGETYRHSYDSDIQMNDNVVFDTSQNIHDGACNGGFNMEEIYTHEIGHLMGMDHSCEDPKKGGGPCTDPELLDATMFWNGGPCDIDAEDPNGDDIQGFTALYGPFASFSCSHQVSEDLVIGVVPFDLNCVLVSDYLSEVTSADWNFGDGGVASALTASHTYEVPGNYTVQMTVHGEREACGPDGWTNDFRKVGYVRACGAPVPEFEVTHVDGLKYKMLNDSDVSVFGCISAIEWQVFAGDSVSGDPILPPVRAWEPVIEFPDAGTYTVIMNLGGIGGTTAAKVTFDAKNTRGEGYGCDSTSGVGSLGLLAAAGALGLVTRRRRS